MSNLGSRWREWRKHRKMLRRHRKRERRAHNRAQILIVSFPKSGRTWLRVLLGKLIADQFGLPEQKMLNSLDYSARAGLNPFHFTHDGSGTADQLTARQLQPRKRRFRHKKVILMFRHPLDIVVSHFFEAKYREWVFEGDIGEFLRDEKFGLPKIVRFYRIWNDQRHVPRDFLLVRYEDLHADPHHTLRRVVDFMGFPGVSEAQIERAVEFARFENMKNMEKQSVFGDKILAPRKAQDNRTYKVREGKVGNYQAYLDERDIAWADLYMKEQACPFLNDAAERTDAA